VKIIHKDRTEYIGEVFQKPKIGCLGVKQAL